MSEWSIEHAWKSTLSARADAQQIPPTQFRINNFRNLNARRRVLANDDIHQGFREGCDTVLTQFPLRFTLTHPAWGWWPRARGGNDFSHADVRDGTSRDRETFESRNELRQAL